jgi:hypothetical protein
MGLYCGLVVSERAKLCRIVTLLITATIPVLNLGCNAIAVTPTPMYETSSRLLVRLDLDADVDGFIEQRTYLTGNVPLRTEIDTDRDGRIDRWEYVDRHAQLLKVGTSSVNDGREDRWVYPEAAGGEQRVDRSTERTSRVDRREFYQGGTIARAEEDTNQDGVFDKWERYEGGVLREVAYDTTRIAGRANRRIVYDARGAYLRLEVDDDGDNQFELVQRAAAQPARN